MRDPRAGRTAVPAPLTLSRRADLCPHLAGLPLRMGAFACVPAPLALKAVTSHRTPQSSPFPSRPLFTVRQPGNGEDYGVRRGVAALASQRSGETGPTPRSARRPLRIWAKLSPKGEGRATPSRRLPHLREGRAGVPRPKGSHVDPPGSAMEPWPAQHCQRPEHASKDGDPAGGGRPRDGAHREVVDCPALAGEARQAIVDPAH